MAQPDTNPHLTFYGDASSRDKDYMVAGGFVFSAGRLAEVERTVAELRSQGGIQSEFHWSDYKWSRRREKAYQDLARYGFNLVKREHAAFYVIIVPFKNYPHRAKKGDTEDTSVNRMYWQIGLHKLARIWGEKRPIHMRLDAGNDSADICNMRSKLCGVARTQYKTAKNCIRTIQAVESHQVGGVQLADVVIGSIAAQMNGNDPDSAKGRLAESIREISGRKTWLRETAPTARWMNVWHFKGK